MDKIYITSKIITIFKEEAYPSEEEVIAYITSLGNIGTKEAVNEILETFYRSSKSSPIKIATYLALSQTCD